MKVLISYFAFPEVTEAIYYEMGWDGGGEGERKGKGLKCEQDVLSENKKKVPCVSRNRSRIFGFIFQRDALSRRCQRDKRDDIIMPQF